MIDVPLGAVPTESGTHFSLFSAHATAVTLCLFEGHVETDRISLSPSGNIWSVHVPEVYVGQAFGYRVDGPFAPEDGHRFNPYKLLIDPYAKALFGTVIEHPSIYGHIGDDDLSFNNQDSAAYMPKGVVTAPNTRREWTRPATPWADTLIYEANVKGLTKKHPAVQPAMRGTVEALANPALIGHLKDLGVTALELLPLQQFHSEPHLTKMGLSNYWGYNPINYFAPHAAYLGPQGEEGLRRSVRALHAAGIEVILDVVYNHTAESWHLGPTLSYKGIDNTSYYALQDDRRFYVNHTGTGNMLDMRSEAMRDLTLASLRHWVTEFGIDGFRFDLAPTLGRMGQGFDASAPMLDAIANDPILSRVKQIAEPWDIGPDGYQLGQFPNGWAEWNDEYRDALRSFWRGDTHAHQSLAGKLLGSSERFDHNGRSAWSSVNFLAAHDGFTLHDTVSFNDKHNAANGEDNRDGHGHNLSDNMGVEGETDDPNIQTRRRDRKAAMLATLLLSQGTPMLLAGDEFGQSQDGNNNAYCQDNETTWLDWSAADADLIAQVKALTALRRRYPHFRQSHFLHGQPLESSALPDVQWITAEGQPMSVGDWEQADRACMGLTLAMPNESTLAVFFNRGEATTITLSDRWTAVFGQRNLDGDAVAVFELPTKEVPDAERPWRIIAHADAAGLHHGFRDITGAWHPMNGDTREAILRALDVDLSERPADAVSADGPITTVYGADRLSDLGSVWGVTTALYALHSESSWGLGDFDTLAQLAETLAPHGCDFIGINPVHALFPGAAHLFAPYSVSSREFLNIMHIAPHQLPEWNGTRPDFDESEFVDYAAVYTAKSTAFETAFAAFQSLPKTHTRRAAFAAYKAQRGNALSQHALYDVLFEQLPQDRQTYAGWRNFAPEFHDPDSAEAHAFAKDHAARIDYYAYLQWNAELQLASAQTRAKAAGMRVGLYLDLAVGVVPGGSDAWRNRAAFAENISLGAPGDAANPDGQRWNLLPLRPDRFNDGQPAERAFRAALRTAMSRAGAIRIDHVLGLSRSFWIPEGAAGGYVTYPFTRLMQIISEESHAAQCIIFGEDLGTVPDGFRDQMAAHSLLGCSVQMIERGHHGEMLPREHARTLAMNAWSNHDFPTVAGFWTERDLAWREQLSIGTDSLPWEREQRGRDRRAIAEMTDLNHTPDQLSAADMAALQAYLAQGPSLAFAVQLDDVLMSEDQPNVPGTTSEQPNWRRRTRLSVDALRHDADARTILTAIDSARPKQKITPMTEIQTTNYDDQKPGTSGLRKQVTVFKQPHYLENFTQAIFDCVPELTGGLLILGGDGRYYNDVAIQTILRIAAANGVAKVMVGQDGILSTPAASNMIRQYGAVGGLVLSASHNPGGPDGDFGIKYNVSNGGPAATSLTDAIFERTKVMETYKTTEGDVDLTTLGDSQLGDMTVTVFNPVTDYADLMETLFDFGAIRDFLAGDLSMIFDAMHAVTGPYAKEVFVNRLGVPAGAMMNAVPLPDFGGGHPDPNPVYAKELFARMFASDAPGFGAASDGDGDRNIVLGRGVYVSPSDSLAVIAANAHLAPAYKDGISGVARSMPTSSAADVVAKAMGIEAHETPTGWKYFCNLLDAGRITVCGEESAGTSSDHVREKDGLWAVLMWLNILTVRRQSVADILSDHWATYGRHYYSRHDYEAVAKDKAETVMARLESQLSALPGTTLHGETIEAADSFTYHDPIDGSAAKNQGLRVMFESGSRFVMRLSGTGTAGATLRLYLEAYEPKDGVHDTDLAERLAPIAAIADELTGLRATVERDGPSVVS